MEEYFKKVEEVGFDVHKLPYADVFEPCLLDGIFTCSVFHTSYHHKTDKEGRIIDIRLLGAIDVKGLLARPLKEWIDYTIYVLVPVPRGS